MLPGTPSRTPNRRDLRRRGRRSPVARSSSILGSLKSFITTPLSWFTSQEDLQEDFEDTPGKRRRNPEAAERDDREHEEGEGRAKRQRVHSPEPEPEPPQQRRRLLSEQPVAGYLDVPEGLIPQHNALPRLSMGHARSSSLATAPPRSSAVRLDRHSLSPLAGPSYVQPLSIARTMSMDPPTGYRPRALSRDVSMGVASAREATMTPSRTPFQVRPRTSMTPQPCGQGFGPAVPRLHRDTSEPPPLETLVSTPQFVKAPLQTQPQRQMPAIEPKLTLGSLAESQPRTRRMSPFGDVPQSRPSLGQSSAVLMARSGSLDGGRKRPENSAEKVLQDLDVYKTPLLPTRLRGAPSTPDMFKTKKMPIPVLMAGEHDKKTRLGSADKEEPGAKPYAGKGGMKKLLMRRKQEEEEDREKDRESAMDDDQDDGPSEVAQQKAPGPRDVPPLPRLIVPEFPPAPAAGRPSSLRVGRNKISRSHAPSVQRGKNRFSAVDEDEDADDAMLTSEDAQAEAPKPPSLFQAPAGFSFAQETAPIKADSSTSKEPPIASLPFSFNKPSSEPPKASAEGAPSVPAVPKEVTQHAALPQSGPAATNQDYAAKVPTVAAGSAPPTTAAAPATPVLQMMPSIALTPPTPAAPSTSAETTGKDATAEKAPSAIPNFFATSAILSKPTAPITLPTGTSLFGGPATTMSSAPASTVAGSTTTTPSATSEVKGAEQREAAKQSAFSFGGAAPDSTARPAGPAAGLFPSPASSASKTPSEISAASGAAVPTSIFGAALAKEPSSSGTPFSFGAPAKPAEQPPAGSSLFGSAPPKPAEPTPKAAANATTTPQPFSFGPPAKPVETATTSSAFSFGAPSKAAEAPAPSLLGPPADIEKRASPAPASGFTFGPPKDQQAKTPEPTSTPAAEPSKPSLFGASSTPFGGFGTATGNTEPAKAPFTFGQPAAPAASTPAVQAPKPLFGGPSSSFPFGGGAQTSTAPAEPVVPAKSPFSFGASPATPPTTSTDKPAFSFGSASETTSAPQAPMMFGGPTGGSHGTDVSSKPFAFGAAAAPARPATPPRHDQEVSMDESPTRGAGMYMNGHGDAKEPLKLTTGFSFGAPGTSAASPFGQNTQASSSTPFGFGGSSSASSIFGGAKTENKQETKTSSGFGFGQQSGSGFGFGQKPADAPAPSSSPAPFGGSAGFGQSSATPSAAAPFGFGPSTSSGSTGGFGQAAATSTTPSPSTFGSTPFSFGVTPTSATAPSNPFSFGSQPASPATANPGLPSASGTTNPPFQFGQPGQASAPSSAAPFGASAAPPPGGAIFNIGAASAPAPTAGGARPVKKLPTRRAGKR